ncbi:MAG: hypothetical protein GY861_11710 [bacterium]|nr:hypothetical protein [bacterium]
MSQATIDKVKDLFGGDYAPIINEDSEPIDFNKPIKGKYRCAIQELKRMEGIGKNSGEPYDFYVLKMKVVEDAEGEPSFNRYMDKTYSNTVSKYQADATEGRKKLMNDLFTAGIEFDVTRETDSTPDTILAEIAPQLVDKLVNVSAYPTKAGRQAVRIVNEFKLTGKKESTEASEDW